MTLPVTGAINFSQIGTEVGQGLLTSVDFNDIDLRRLVNKLTDKSQISANDFHGKQFGVGPGYALADFTAVTGVVPSSVMTSNTIYATVDSSVAIFCDTAAQYSINGGVWTDKSVLGAIIAGQTLAVRCTASSEYSTNTPVTANLGGTLKVYGVTTGALKTVQIGFQSMTLISWSLDVYGRRNSATGASISMTIGMPVTGAFSFGTLSNTVGVVDVTPHLNYTYDLTSDRYYTDGFITLACLDSDPLPVIPSNTLSVNTNPGNTIDVGTCTIHGRQYKVRIGGSAYAGGSSMIANAGGECRVALA